MTRDPNDVVKVFAGTMIEVQSFEQLLADAGIESKVVGSELSGSFGSALPGAIELWTHRSDAEKATATIQGDEERIKRGHHESRHAPPESKFPHPTSDPKPGPAPVRKEPYVNPNPSGK